MMQLVGDHDRIQAAATLRLLDDRRVRMGFSLRACPPHSYQSQREETHDFTWFYGSRHLKHSALASRVLRRVDMAGLLV